MWAAALYSPDVVPFCPFSSLRITPSTYAHLHPQLVTQSQTRNTLKMSAFMEKNDAEGPGGGLPTTGAHFDMEPSTPTVPKSSTAPTAGSHPHHQGWRARRRAKHHERRIHHEAKQVEKGLPEIFHGKDLEGQERLERASKLLRVKNEMIAVS